MKRELTDEQIAQARALRAEGKTYAEIRDAIDAEVEPDTIRAHCADIAIAGKVRTRQAKGVSKGKDGRVIKPYADWEDEAIIKWTNEVYRRPGGQRPQDENMNGLAKRLGRQRHSVAARQRTLQKNGKL